MIPVKFAGMNSVFTADGCDDLPALKREHETTGMTSVTSCWKPTDEEIEDLKAGGVVCLAVIGGQPPVSLWTQQVQIEAEEVMLNDLSLQSQD